MAKNYNSLFEDLLDEINKIAKSKGFENGIGWANTAKTYGEIDAFWFDIFLGIHKLRNSFSHGHAKDISISEETYNNTIKFKELISSSKLTSNDSVDFSRGEKPLEGAYIMFCKMNLTWNGDKWDVKSYDKEEYPNASWETVEKIIEKAFKNRDEIIEHDKAEAENKEFPVLYDEYFVIHSMRSEVPNLEFGAYQGFSYEPEDDVYSVVKRPESITIDYVKEIVKNFYFKGVGPSDFRWN